MRPPKSVLTHALIAMLALAGLIAAPYVAEPDGAGIRPGKLPDEWIVGGPNCMEVPDFQVHE